MSIEGIKIVEKIRKAVRHDRVSTEQLFKDLEKYRNLAIQYGATDAKIITTDMISVDERVRFKCYTCDQYGKSAMCPPHILGTEGTLDYTRRFINRYKYGILILKKEEPTPVRPPGSRKAGEIGWSGKPIWDIMRKIESTAFYDGYYFAIGLASGPCLGHLGCLDSGKGCTHPAYTHNSKDVCPHVIKARPAMEGMGIDDFDIAQKVGWDVYPIGTTAKPDQVPFGIRLVLVFIE